MNIRKEIPYSTQKITNQDIQSVKKVLKSGFLTQGPVLKEFEDKFSKRIGSKYAIAVSNGTAALHLCTVALGLKKGDKVITTPNTFIATANSIRYCGGEVVFSDIDSEKHILDINKVRKLLEASPIGTYKGIMPVDFAGIAVDLEEFRKLADEFKLWIIEDACHAPGGYFTDSKGINQNCGNGVYADLSIFSFHPVKHIACGEGGMITTNNKKLRDKLLNIRTHGIQQDYSLKKYDLGPWYYEMQELGFNYRLSDIHASLGISQLSKLDKGNYKRASLVKKYEKAFENEKFIISTPGFIKGHAYHLYVIEVKDRLGLYLYLKRHNIYSQVHYVPCYRMPYYKNFGHKKENFPETEKYYSRCLSIPLFPSLTFKEQSLVIKTIKNYYIK